MKVVVSPAAFACVGSVPGSAPMALMIAGRIGTQT